VAGDDTRILTVGSTSPGAQLDVLLYAPDGSVLASIAGTTSDQTFKLGSVAGPHRLVVGPSSAPDATGTVGYAVAVASELRYALAFGELLDDIDELEARTERYNSDLDELNTAVFGDGFAIDLGADFEARLTTYQTRHRELQEQFDDDMRSLVAALDAKPLEDTPFGESDLEPVRDAAVEHYRAWLDYVPEYQLAVEDWAFAALRGTTSDSLILYSRDRLEPFRQAVDDSFFRLCSSLSAEQPSSGQFEQRIADECTD
jgi:hypothetical protein